MPQVEITNMVMVYDPNNQKVLVQNRRKNWQGITFPGGHIEKDESVYQSAVREVKEETGLDIENLTSCGHVLWLNTDTQDKYFVFLFKTDCFSGTLIGGTEEGEVFWVNQNNLLSMQLSPNFGRYLPMFTEGKYSEVVCKWSKSNSNCLFEYK